jgi:hypothetical protein
MEELIAHLEYNSCIQVITAVGQVLEVQAYLSTDTPSKIRNSYNERE